MNMTTTATLPDAVQWNEGMLLLPQHMQQERLYWHAQIGWRFAAAQPDGWGVRVLEIDRAALVQGILVVNRLECVLPDGSIVLHARTGAADALSLQLGDTRAPLRIHAAVRLHGDVAAVPGHAERRYDQAEPAIAIDENTGLEPLPVERLRLRVELVATAPDAALPGGLCGCPLLQVERDEQGLLALASYHPPMLRLDASGFQGEAGLQRRLDDLVQRLWNKLQELCAADDAAPSSDDQPTGGAARQRAAAIAIAAAMPPLGACASDGQAHPRAVYQALAAAAGALSALDGRPVPYRMQPYLHLDCNPRFTDACRYLEARLETVHASFERLRFSQFKDGFARRLPHDAGSDLIVELRPQPGMSVTESSHWLAGASIAGSDMLHTVQSQRQRPRVRRVREDEARQYGLPLEAVLFWIQNDRIHSEGRDAFQPGENLMIQGNDRRGMPAQLFLYRHKAAPGAMQPSAQGASRA